MTMSMENMLIIRERRPLMVLRIPRPNTGETGKMISVMNSKRQSLRAPLTALQRMDANA